MIVISSTKLAKLLDGRAGAGLPSIIQRWPGRNSHEILPGLFLNWVIAGAAFAIRQLPGMAMFNPMMLSMAIGIAFHNIVGTAARAEQGVTFSLRRLLGIVILPFGSQLTSSRLVTHADDKDVAYAIACVTIFGSVAMFADPIATDAEAWIVAATTSLSIALAAIGLETNIGQAGGEGLSACLARHARVAVYRGLQPHADQIDGVTRHDSGAASHLHRGGRKAACYAGRKPTEFDAISNERRDRGAGDALRNQAV
jgi:uncharacterized membrane protein YadS